MNVGGKDHITNEELYGSLKPTPLRFKKDWWDLQDTALDTRKKLQTNLSYGNLSMEQGIGDDTLLQNAGVESTSEDR